MFFVADTLSRMENSLRLCCLQASPEALVVAVTHASSCRKRGGWADWLTSGSAMHSVIA